MDNQTIYYIMGGAAGAFVLIVIIYYILSKKMQTSEYKRIQKLQQGTKEKSFSSEILFQKLYLTYVKIPFIKRYVLKIRRRLEIINIDDEYNTRKGTARILTKSLAIIVPIMLVTIIITSSNYLLMFILLIFELFMIDTFIDGSVDKIDDKILKEQIDFFSEIRHAYHEFNMVEEAIYQVSQDDEKDVSRQGEKIYEILISDDPEMELEKYYDIAPNSFLKEFAGISYLTKEFGDRKVDGASLYLKNVNNITQEMQLEILKRDKLNYVFQSLSVISIAPVLLLEPLKSWAISNFSFTASWYQGKPGMIVQIIILILTYEKGSDFLVETTDLKNDEENTIQADCKETKVVEQTSNLENNNSPETLNKISSESNFIDIENINTTNCLALTIQEDHKIVVAKNVFLHSIRMSWKVITSTIILTIIKLFC